MLSEERKKGIFALVIIIGIDFKLLIYGTKTIRLCFTSPKLG
jgi:hypothetical protein